MSSTARKSAHISSISANEDGNLPSKEINIPEPSGNNSPEPSENLQGPKGHRLKLSINPPKLITEAPSSPEARLFSVWSASTGTTYSSTAVPPTGPKGRRKSNTEAADAASATEILERHASTVKNARPSKHHNTAFAVNRDIATPPRASVLAKAQRAYDRISTFYMAPTSNCSRHSVPKGALSRDEVLHAYEARVVEIELGEGEKGDPVVVDSDSEVEFQTAKRLATERREMREARRREMMDWREKWLASG